MPNMRTIPLTELASKGDVALSSLFAMQQSWPEGLVFHMDVPRKQSALLWFCGCRGVFHTRDGQVLEVARGGLVYIPQGSEYSLQFQDCGAMPSTILIELCLNDGQPFALSEGVVLLSPLLEEGSMTDILLRLVRDFSMPSKPWLDIRGGVYCLLAMLAGREESKHLQRGGMKTIEKGIRYLQTDEEQRLSIEEVAAMCAVSPVYFRKMFHAYAGVSPSVYRANRRMERAKDLLCHSDLSIEEIAERLHFDTPSYFCRAFKRSVGLPPSTYRKQACFEK